MLLLEVTSPQTDGQEAEVAVGLAAADSVCARRKSLWSAGPWGDTEGHPLVQTGGPAGEGPWSCSGVAVRAGERQNPPLGAGVCSFSGAGGAGRLRAQGPPSPQGR